LRVGPPSEIDKFYGRNRFGSDKHDYFNYFIIPGNLLNLINSCSIKQKLKVDLCVKKKDIKSIFRSSLFWDAGEIDAAEHAAYIIARILDYGSIEDVRALRELYPDEKIVETVRTRRNLLPKTGKYWAVKLNIPLEEVPCLKKYYHLKQST
jgi:hypothetical protein